MSNDLKVGDVVRLKHIGGPNMLIAVVWSATDNIDAVWFDKVGVYHSIRIAAAVLERARP